MTNAGDAIPLDSVTVALVTYNSAAVLGGFLDSLETGLAGVVRHRLVVVDNASSDGSLELVAERVPEARLVQLGANRGYAAGVNAAAAADRDTAAVLIVNPDVRLGRGSVRHLLDALGEPGLGIAVPRITHPDGTLDPSLRREPSALRTWGEALLGGPRAGRVGALGETVTDPRCYTHPREVDWASGAVLLVRRDCLDRAGPWDESFFLYSEETEFCLRARDLGFATRYVPAATAVHLRGEAETSPALRSLAARNKVALHRRRHGRLAAAAMQAGLLANEALRAPRHAAHRATFRALLRPVREAGPRAGAAGATAAPDIVYLSGMDWWYHSHAHADFQLMLRVARERRVLFVNAIGTRVPLPGRSEQVLRRFRRKARSIAKTLRRPLPDLPDLWVMTPVSIPVGGSARRWNAASVRLQVALAMRRVGISDPIVITSTLPAWDVVRPMRRRALVYNRCDRHSAYTEADPGAMRRLENALLSGADGVLYVTRALMDEEAALTGARAFFLDHGVDLEHFRPGTGPEPADLAAIPRPRAGFIGVLRDYTVDVGLLAHLARSLPHIQVVLVGDAQCSIDDLLALPNVHWLGSRPYEEVPAYASAMDVGLMPWLQNDWIRYCNPIKLKEQLALGLPVVSTPFGDAEHYHDVIEVAGDPDGFVAAVERVLAGGGRATAEERRRAVAGAPWDERSRQLLTFVDGLAGETH